MARQNHPYMNFQPSWEEKEILEAYCKKKGLTRSQVLRAYIRKLPDYRTQATQEGASKPE